MDKPKLEPELEPEWHDPMPRIDHRQKFIEISFELEELRQACGHLLDEWSGDGETQASVNNEVRIMAKLLDVEKDGPWYTIDDLTLLGTSSADIPE